MITDSHPSHRNGGPYPEDFLETPCHAVASAGHPSDTPSALCSTNLSLWYGDKPAFQAVSAMVGKGRITALVGPSGCGKSSYLMCFNRLTDLISGCRVTGHIRVGSDDVLDNSTDVVSLRRRVGMIFQKPNPFPFSIRRNFEIPLKENGISERMDIEEITEASLRSVGLWNEVKDRLGASALNLSGGQQQRLCIARALSLKPEVLLLDEPCSALDPIAGGVVEDMISGLKERYTVVIVTHNLAQARRIADEVMVFWMREGCGSLIEQGETAQIFEAPRDAITAAYVNGVRG